MREHIKEMLEVCGPEQVINALTDYILNTKRRMNNLIKNGLVWQVLPLLPLVLILGLLGFSYTSRIEISSHKEIPIVNGVFQMGPSTDFPVPFEVTQIFHVPEGATEICGTIAWGPCEKAEFVGATPGYTSGGFPTQACSWIDWDPAPDVVSVTVEYVGNWWVEYHAHVAWYALENGNWVSYCLLGEAPCGTSLVIEPQPAFIYLPIVIRESGMGIGKEGGDAN